MSDSVNKGGTPRAMIHQRIMDAAAAEPNAALDELADAVPGASLGMVERVLDEYGDPAENETTDSAADAGVQMPRLDSLTEKQRETIVAIRDDPEATQRELADRLDVSAATISQRVHGIPGFEWADRASFATALLDAEDATDASAVPDPDGDQRTDSDDHPEGDATGDDTAAGADRIRGSTRTESNRPLIKRPIVRATDGTDSSVETADIGSSPDVGTDSPAPGAETMDGDTDDTTANAEVEHAEDHDEAVTGTASVQAPDPATAFDGGARSEETAEQVANLQDRLTELEARLDAVAAPDADGPNSGLTDSELAAKVVRACVEDDEIESAEEVTIIESLLD